MADLFKNILDKLKLPTDDEDFDDDYDDYLSAAEERKIKREERMEQKSFKNQAPVYAKKEEPNNVTFATEPKKERVPRMERTTSNKVVPIRTTPKGFEVCILKPSTFDDSQDICDMLLSGRAAVINLEGFDVDLAQRIMDFVSGAVYALNGKLHQISSYIFIICPDTVDISGDYLDLIQSDGFEVPTLNKEF